VRLENIEEKESQVDQEKENKGEREKKKSQVGQMFLSRLASTDEKQQPPAPQMACEMDYGDARANSHLAGNQSMGQS
jgi:hypothetical protein